MIYELPKFEYPLVRYSTKYLIGVFETAVLVFELWWVEHLKYPPNSPMRLYAWKKASEADKLLAALREFLIEKRDIYPEFLREIEHEIEMDVQS
jgi:hypothetical protein